MSGRGGRGGRGGGRGGFGRGTVTIAGTELNWDLTGLDIRRTPAERFPVSTCPFLIAPALACAQLQRIPSKAHFCTCAFPVALRGCISCCASRHETRAISCLSQHHNKHVLDTAAKTSAGMPSTTGPTTNRRRGGDGPTLPRSPRSHSRRPFLHNSQRWHEKWSEEKG